MFELPPRQIIRELEFDEQLAALLPGDFEEADKFTAAAEDLLSRLPDSGMVGAGGVWELSMAPVRDKRVTLYYTFSETTVYFLAILPFDD